MFFFPKVEELMKKRRAQANATLLEMVTIHLWDSPLVWVVCVDPQCTFQMGDRPDANVTAPENVLFVAQLNPVTTSEDLKIIFSRFGSIVEVLNFCLCPHWVSVIFNTFPIVWGHQRQENSRITSVCFYRIWKGWGLRRSEFLQDLWTAVAVVYVCVYLCLCVFTSF